MQEGCEYPHFLLTYRLLGLRAPPGSKGRPRDPHSAGIVPRADLSVNHLVQKLTAPV